jgi:hypothetical protein
MYNIDRPDRHVEGGWLDDANETPAPEEQQELLQVATRLASALTPLREMAQSEASIRPYQYPSRRGVPAHRRGRWPGGIASLRTGLLAAVIALLFSLTVMSIAPGAGRLWQGATQVLHASTSLEQINGVSLDSLARPHAGIRPLPLLPTVVPAHTQAITYGVLTDISNPDVMTTFVADYHIDGQDVLLYEQPSDVQFLSPSAPTVQIGTRQGQLFQDNAGNHALQWYQNAMLCQLTSKLPTALLIQLASVFQPIKSWDLIR